MTLAQGSRLGAYEVLAPIGAGGMGEVYKARDTRLGREVAIKVLPQELTSDPARIRRFEKEARAASALSHPNIVTIYDVGREGAVSYLAMEFVAGSTLRELLAEGPLPVKKALAIAADVAQGLARAHAAGIVHRDLKPENVMVGSDGFVKILDFGLAKLTRPESDSAHGTHIPTVSLPTEAGVVMGTVGYMSPEQASGLPVDFRSDQFSLAAVMYEALSGQRAFAGASAAQTLAEIIESEPEPIASVNPRVPAPVGWIVERCLAKDLKRRYASTEDLARDLATVRDRFSELGKAGEQRPEMSPIARRAGSLAVLGGLLATLAIGLFAGRWVWRAGPAVPPTYRALTFRRGPIWSARFAPDGQTAVYAASWDGAQKSELFSVRVDSPESLRLALSPGLVASISRRGEMLLWNQLHFSTGMTRTGTLSQAPLSGNAPRELLEDVGGADWSPDGVALAVVRAPQWRYRLEFPVGKVLYETTGWISDPRVSPKGDVVAFLDHPVFGDDLGSVALVDRLGKFTILSAGWGSVQGVAWSANGEEIWFTAAREALNRSLYAVTPSGRLRTVATTAGGMFLQDVSRDGRVLLTHSHSRLGLLSLLPGEAKERDLSSLAWSILPILFEDAKTVVFTEQSQEYSVYLRKLDGSPAVRLGEGTALAISPDGKWVLTCLFRPAPAQIMLLPTGAGEPRSLPRDSIDHGGGNFAGFLPDGKSIVFAAKEPGRPLRVFLQDLAGGAARPVTPEGVVASLLSPDGKSLLISTEQGFASTPLEGGPSHPIPGLEPGDWPLLWTSDGRSLFIGHRGRELPARVFRVDIETGRREVWKELMPADASGIEELGPWAISADGKTILFQYSRTLSELYLAEGLK